MTTPEITRIRAALAEWQPVDVDVLAAACFRRACNPAAMRSVLAHIDAQATEIDRLNADRRVLQATGEHPAPCARHCEAMAFAIEIRRLKKANGLLDSALSAAFPRGASGEVFERWNAARIITATKETP